MFPQYQWPAAIAGAVVVIASVLAFALRKRPKPEEAERIRREQVNREGRILDGVITDIEDTTVYFAYVVNGVHYHTTQDVSTITEYLPREPHRSIGPASLKVINNNPANSIVVCEQWSGFRTRN